METSHLKILNFVGTATYAICTSHCSEHDHHDEHVHFTCIKCNSVYCLDEAIVPTIQLPQGFSLKSVGIQATGICQKCQK